jgi:hypothetical protein
VFVGAVKGNGSTQLSQRTNHQTKGTTMTKNLNAASKALAAELNAGRAEHEDVAEYLRSVDAIVEQARSIKALYKKELAVEASRKSRAKRAAEVAAMTARLAELEASAK